ncbi:hypothetical protein [Nonomuraea sediminis]|uniref:hypothetical protein n=1 Tax=Nonomuraea sediminis TaxID=2835864 RepID=UPI001BDC0CDC|nr:hypothetical protein [Nonomuraea sediminis]
MKNPMLAALVAAAALLSTATPAYAEPTPWPAPTHAEPAILGVSVSPNPVVLRPGESRTVTVTVNGRDLREVRISIGSGRYAPLSGGWSASTTVGWDDPEGTWPVHVSATGADGRQYTADSSFTVRHEGYRNPGPRATRIAGFDASPEPVRKGRKLTLTGELQVAQCYGDSDHVWDGSGRTRGDDDYCRDDSWNDWQRLGGREIGVYFLPKGSHRWQYVDTIETDDDGSFATQVRAYRSGTWGVRSGATGGLGSSEAYDYVRVKR